MKFNIFFTIRGPAASLEAPNTTNPVEADDLSALLELLKDCLPQNLSLGIQVVGIRIVLHEQTEPKE